MNLSIDSNRLVWAISRTLRQHVVPALSSTDAKPYVEALDRATACHIAAQQEHSLAALDGPADGGDVLRYLTEVRARSSAVEQMGAASSTSDIADVHQAIDEAQLTQYLRERFSDDPDVRARGLFSPSGGYSKETFLFELVRSDGRVEPMAIRRDKRISSTGTSVLQEYPLICGLHRAGFATSPPAWSETASDIIPGAMIFTHRVPGEQAGNHQGPFPNLGGDPIRILATTLAGLHAIDVRQLAVPGMSDCPFDLEYVGRSLDHWRQWYDAGGDRDPVLEIAFDWLRGNRKWGVTPPVVVHGDFGFHNLLVDRSSGAAYLLDWEAAQLGSAAQDIARARAGLATAEDFRRFLLLYEEAGGVLPTDQALKYYEIFRLLRSAVVYRRSVTRFNNGDHGDIRQMSICAMLYPGLTSTICDELIGSVEKVGFSM